MVLERVKKEAMPSMLLGAETLRWVTEMKYLGVSIYSKQGLKANIDIKTVGNLSDLLLVYYRNVVIYKNLYCVK